MPRWACRLRLEVVSVRPERLQSITEDDARREGVAPQRLGPCAHAHAFEAAWRKMHGADAWDRNPWVWRVEFRRQDVAS